jgi:iron complex outermembrane receptor protein
LFLQHEWQFRPGWTVDLGLRFDESQNHGHFLSPRIALVYRHSSRTTYKLIGGVAFRDPSVYEQFYDDRGISQAPNPLLRPEQIHNVEACVERKLGRRLNAVATAYYYQLRDLIEAVPLTDGLVQYRNVSRYKATGAEFEMNGNPWKDLEASASIAIEDMNKRSTGERPPNSPVAVGKARLAVPFDRGRFSIAGSFQYLSPRTTFASAEVTSAYLADLTVTTSRLHPSFDVQFGVRNLFDRRAWDPASPDQGLDRLARDGRSAFIKLVWHTRQ